jgi:FkbM family methyltransferase
MLKNFSPKAAFMHQIDWGPAKGLNLLISLPHDKEMWKGTYEEGFCCRLGKVIQNGDICYDIGAFRGYTAGVMALAGADRVLSFEPMPKNQQTIVQMIENNPKLPIQLIKKAVSCSAEEQLLQINQDESMNVLVQGKQETDKTCLSVETTTVDLTAEQTGLWPHILKIDVEGWEELVLRGAQAALKKSVRAVFLEIHNRQAEECCLAVLEAAGFACLWRDKEWGKYANQTMFQKKCP